MCGIVGLFLKDQSLQPQLGRLLSDMLVTMTDRGPDSAGVALYSDEENNTLKVTLQSLDPLNEFSDLQEVISAELDCTIPVQVIDTHAIARVPADRLDHFSTALQKLKPALRVMSTGKSVEIYKEVGLPEAVIARFALNTQTGSHGIGHTRMATESAVTTLGAHPFSTGYDQCLVHNGSLSNHNIKRRELIHEGLSFETENDTEVAAAYLTHKLNQGCSLGEALEAGIDDLDGFYTFVVGTQNGFGVLRDPIACKPAVLAETDQYVAFGSEYRALVNLPDIQTAKVWEPEPATVYFWEH